jgi:methionyl-tRNA formyltransferase
MLELAPHGALNVHPSLLPRYRGSSPVRAAILNGDEETGVSIIKLVRRLDAGPIVAQRRVAILPGEDAAQLTERLALVAADMLPGTCLGWMDGSLAAIEQDEDAATMTREWTRDDARIDWTQPAVQIERLVRAAQPWPVAWTTLAGEPFRLHRAVPRDNPGLAAGRVRRSDGRILAGCATGALELIDVQPQGKRVMPAANWWNGLRTDEVSFDNQPGSH